MSEVGKVYLVGSGPGDPGLLTVKGANLIAKADVIVYDYLVNPSILKGKRPNSELIYVGKSFKGHTLSQDEINELLVDLSKKHQSIVRLKGGDPFVFGRGGEEAEVLAQASIPFEIVPGITSAVAAPAYAGIPITHREYNSMVSFITGHEDPTKENSHLDWAKLANNHSTLVFLMGVGQSPEMARKLIANGMDPKTPVAFIHWGTWNKQKTYTGTLDTIQEVVRKNKIQPPSVIVVGKVVGLREKLAWFEKRPLLGKKVVVTRARAQASDLTLKLEDLGAEVIECPTIKIIFPKENDLLDQEIQKLKEYDWLIFTSVNGVDAFFQRLFACGLDMRALGGVNVCAIGPATRDALCGRGVVADCMPPKYVAESILETLQSQTDLKGKKILIPRAKEAREYLVKELSQVGAQVKEVAVYETVTDEEKKEDLLENFKQNPPDMVTFTSSSTVKNFVSLVGKEGLNGLFSKTGFISIGPITTQTAQECGLKIAAQAEEYTIDGLVETILLKYE